MFAAVDPGCPEREVPTPKVKLLLGQQLHENKNMDLGALPWIRR